MYDKYKNGREKVSWRKEFKSHWKNLAKREFSGELYYTNTEQWICSCPAFLKDRFFLCKHLVKLANSYNAITKEFFNNVQRQGIYPLLGMISDEQNHFNAKEKVKEVEEIEIPKEIQEIETEEIEGNRFLIFI